MSTTSKHCCSATQVATIVTGALALVGAGAILWFLLARRHPEELDPQTELDRRISELESSLGHLQDAFGRAVR